MSREGCRLQCDDTDLHQGRIWPISPLAKVLMFNTMFQHKFKVILCVSKARTKAKDEPCQQSEACLPSPSGDLQRVEMDAKRCCVALGTAQGKLPWD